MPSHHFVCRQCGDKQIIDSTITMPSPPHPYCHKCHRTYAKVFGFNTTPMQIEISSPHGKFGSERAYNTARDQRSAEHSERVGREVTFESFDPRDPDQDPRKPLK